MHFAEPAELCRAGSTLISPALDLFARLAGSGTCIQERDTLASFGRRTNKRALRVRVANAQQQCCRERDRPRYTTRSASIFFTSAMALAGLRPLGQTWAQFMMVWQR